MDCHALIASVSSSVHGEPVHTSNSRRRTGASSLSEGAPMASAGSVDVKVAVKPKVSVGTSTVAGGSVSLVAFMLAAVAFWQGARDETTLSVLAVGVVSLVTVLGGRYAQAVAALFVVAQKPAPTTPPAYAFGTLGATTASTGHVTWGAGGPTPATKPGEFDGEPETPPEAELRDLHENDLT